MQVVIVVQNQVMAKQSIRLMMYMIMMILMNMHLVLQRILPMTSLEKIVGKHMNMDMMKRMIIGWMKWGNRKYEARGRLGGGYICRKIQMKIFYIMHW